MPHAALFRVPTSSPGDVSGLVRLLGAGAFAAEDVLQHLMRLAAHLHGLDRKRVMDRLAQTPPETFADVEKVLRFAGWPDAISLGSR